MQKTFFTAVGSRDPHDIKTPDQDGPCLDMLQGLLEKGHQFTDIIIAWTPNDEYTIYTKKGSS